MHPPENTPVHTHNIPIQLQFSLSNKGVGLMGIRFLIKPTQLRGNFTSKVMSLLESFVYWRWSVRLSSIKHRLC